MTDGFADGSRIDRPRPLPHLPPRRRDDHVLAAAILLARPALGVALLDQAIDQARDVGLCDQHLPLNLERSQPGFACPV
jgi:hypothetical protein